MKENFIQKCSRKITNISARIEFSENLSFRFDLKYLSYLFILLLFKKVSLTLFDFAHKGKFYSKMFAENQKYIGADWILGKFEL